MSFDSFLGNSPAVATLRGMLTRSAVPSAMLFCGPAGVGKKTLAQMFARALNCERLKDDFCGACTGCRKSGEMLALASEDLARRREIKDATRRVEALSYFDVQLIEPITRFILTEQIRQLRTVAYTRPFELRHRLFIIDEAQAIHWQAVDLLLKVMEEPPDTTTLVLICPNPYELRATIRSRCHLLRFRPVEDSLIEKVLREEKRLSGTDLALAMRVAAGSIANARDFDLAAFRVRRAAWIDFLDVVTAEGLTSLNGAAWKSLFDSTKALSENRNQLDQTLQTGYTLLHDMLHLAGHRDDRGVINVDLVSRLRAWFQKLGLDGIEKLKAGFDEARRLQVRNVNQQLGWESLAVELLTTISPEAGR